MLSCLKAFCLTTTGVSTTSTGEEGKHMLFGCGVLCSKD